MSRALMLLGLLVMAIPALANDFETYYGRGHAARQAGDHAAAIEHYSNARAQAPEHVEVLFYLGLVLGFEGRHPEAHEVLVEAEALDPDNHDVALALARVSAWLQRYDEADGRIAKILAHDPAHGQALLLSGRLAFWRHDLAAAAVALDRLLLQEPDNLEALILRGDVAYADGNPDLAKVYYDRALARDPSSAADERLRRMDIRRWRLTTGATLSDLDSDFDDWQDSFVEVGYDLMKDLALHLRGERNARFGKIDTSLEVGLGGRLAPAFHYHLRLGATPSADFRERWSVSAGGSARLHAGGDILGATVLTLDSKLARYGPGPVKILMPGLSQYLFAGRVNVSGRWINAFDEDGEHLPGWLARIDVIPLAGLRLFAGTADAVQSSMFRLIDTRSVFGGLTYRFEGHTLGLTFERDRVEGSYERNALSLALTLRF
jgi:YaiO family outer membrane protein